MKWYEANVQQVEKQVKELEHSPATLFYGSSSIRLWNTLYDDFKPYCPANMGFCGSTLEACVYFFPRMMKHLNPKHLVVYAGDNDLGDGKSPEMVLKYFIQLNSQIRNQFGDIPYTYLSVKPSITRWHINTTIKHTNLLIKNVITSWKNNTFFVEIYTPTLDQTGFPRKKFYDADGLHLSTDG